MIRVSGQSKSRPVKAAGAEVGGERRHQKLHPAVAKSTFWSENAKKLTVSDHFFEVQMSKNCTPLWRKAHSEVKMLKNWGSESTFGSSDVEKIVRRCGEKHIWKWKCQKNADTGTLFQLQMSKNCTPLWRKAHLEVKIYKTCGVRSTFVRSNVEKWYAAVGEKQIS